MLVDEYQDTNVAQYLWLRLMAQGNRQSLLRRRRRPIDLWLARRRGGKHPAVRARLSRRESHPAGAQLPLDAGDSSALRRRLIAHNKGRLGKTLWTDGASGDKVQVKGCWDAEEEARVIGEDIEHLSGRTTL